MKQPLVYCEVEKHIFHTSTEYKGDLYIFGGITSNMSILNLPKIEDNSLEIMTNLKDYIETTSKENYSYLYNMDGFNIINDKSSVQNEEIEVSNDKSILNETGINEIKPLVLMDKNSGKWSINTSQKSVKSPGKDSAKTGKSSKKSLWDQDYEVNEG